MKLASLTKRRAASMTDWRLANFELDAEIRSASQIKARIALIEKTKRYGD